MLTPEQRADKWRRVRASLDGWEAAGVSVEEWIRIARDGLTWTDLRETLTALDEALEENAALKERLREMHLLLALAWGAIRAGRDLVDLNGPDSRLAAWCEGVDGIVPEWETEARALLDPQAPAEGRQKEE
jgi:hypothetical protein